MLSSLMTFPPATQLNAATNVNERRVRRLPWDEGPY